MSIIQMIIDVEISFENLSHLLIFYGKKWKIDRWEIDSKNINNYYK
jgi:hypothetical protein